MKRTTLDTGFLRHPLWLLAGGWWLWLVWACAGEWTRSEDYNYGWLVPPLAMYFLWKRMESAPRGAAPGGGAAGAAAWGFIFISLLFVMPVEMVRQTPIHWRPVLWAIGLLAAGNTMAAAWLTGGRRTAGMFLLPSLFMLLAVPWPTFLENAVAFPLMQIVTGWSVSLVHMLGYPARAAGTTIALPNCTVGVEEACSGLRSLQTALMVGVAAGELARLGIRGRGILLVSAFVLAVAGNQVRVLILVLAGIQGGNAAVERLHDAAGYAVLGILLSGVAVVAWFLVWISDGAENEEGRTPEEASPGIPCVPRRTVAWLAVGLACAAMLGAHGWFWWRASLAAKPVPAMLSPAAGRGFVVDGNVPESILGVLQPDDHSYIRERLGEKATRVIGYHFFWEPREGNANQLYHRPDRCMPGAGWRIDGEVTRETVRLGGREFTFNVFPFRGPAGPALMLWGSYLNGEPVQVEFNTDVYVNTANMWQFIRTGTRVYSYEVAACIMPYDGGHRPSREEVEAYAARVFEATGAGGGGG